MNESTLVPREEMSDLDWLARNHHTWPSKADTVVSIGWKCMKVGEPNYVRVNLGKEIAKDQWLSRRAELQNKPSWKDAPEWAQWMAQSPNGHWEFFSVKPHANDWWRHPAGERSSANNASIRGAILGDWRDTLEKRPEQDEFEPFVSVEDAKPKFPRGVDYVGILNAAIANQQSITKSKYTKTIHGVSVDVYDILQAWGVSNPALQHLIKKALQCGQRGHKDNAQDLQDIIDSAIRAKELDC